MDYIRRYNVCVILLVVFCILSMVMYPIDVSKSAIIGFDMWKDSIFPTLFPFFVCINMLVDLGFAKFMGEILSPIMNPLFGISGIGSFPLFSGIMSGYPVGAKTTATLYVDKKLNQKESQRLIAFSNNCGPLFIIGVVGGYIFKSVIIGYYILFVHILSSITFAVILNIFFGSVHNKQKSNKNYIREAFKQMRVHTTNNNKTFGKILSDSVESGIKSVLTVLGFVVIFSVFGTIIELLHIHEFLIYVVNTLMNTNIDGKLIEAIFLGSIEMTAGLFLLDGEINLLNIMVATYIVTFGGFSVHAQSISFIVKTNLNSMKYILDKFICSIISAVIVFISYPFISRVSIPVFNQSKRNSNSINFYFACAIFFIFIIYAFMLFVDKKSID